MCIVGHPSDHLDTKVIDKWRPKILPCEVSLYMSSDAALDKADANVDDVDNDEP